MAEKKAKQTTKKTTLKTQTPRRAVIIAGTRTPFVRAFGEYIKIDTIGLGTAAVNALIERTGLPRKEVESVIWGGVILPGTATNVAREIGLDAQLPRSIEAMTVSRACASGLQAITSAAALIERGEADVVIAGGSDSTSNAEIAMPQKIIHAAAPVVLGKPTPKDYLGVIANFFPLREALPRRPKIAERTTGQVMGEAADEMARRNEISREAQDEYAHRTHHRAAEAIASGIYDNEVAAIETAPGKWVHVDGQVRGDTTIEKLARLKPVFFKDGTVTAGNACGLSDGAAAVLLMEEAKAKALGLKPLAAFKSWAYAGVDPADQLLMGPALAMPRALDRAGMKLSDIDFVDMHEAFAAQVLSIVKMIGSKAFAKHRLGRDKAVGEIGPDRLNLHGGSIALGHPFGATGARMTTTVANELQRGDKQTALIGICAAGGLGAGAVLERV